MNPPPRRRILHLQLNVTGSGERSLKRELWRPLTHRSKSLRHGNCTGVGRWMKWRGTSGMAGCCLLVVFPVNLEKATSRGIQGFLFPY